MNARISYHYKKNFADFNMERTHTHEMNNFEIMYVKEGACIVETAEKEYHLSAGSFILLGNCCPHLLSARNATILNIEFDIRQGNMNISDVLERFPEIREIFSFHALYLLDKSEVFSALEALIAELHVNGEGFCAELMFKRLLIEICRSYKKRQSPSEHYIREATEYIEENFCRNISVSEIAAQIGLNRSYLQTLFKSVTGKTVLEYINSLRIEKACFIMKNTDLPVIDIALDCGFASRQHFMYIFKKTTGMTARQYRGGREENYERD